MFVFTKILNSRFSVFTDLHRNICVFHLIPGFDDDCISAYIEKHNESNAKSDKAMVFALYGTGNAPLRKDGFLRVIQMALDAGIAVVVTTQCLHGRYYFFLCICFFQHI